MSPLFSRWVVRFNPDTGGYDLRLSDDDRAVLRHLAPQFVELLDEPDHPVMQRLFPPAYSDPAHVEQRDEYRRLMQEDLVAHRREELELLLSTADATSLSEDQLLAWSRALNSIRLVLGTHIGISEESDSRKPSSPEESVYGWLTYLLGETIEALSGQN